MQFRYAGVGVRDEKQFSRNDPIKRDFIDSAGPFFYYYYYYYSERHIDLAEVRAKNLLILPLTESYQQF